MRISDWSSDVCSSDLMRIADVQGRGDGVVSAGRAAAEAAIAVVLGAVLQKGGEAEIDPQRRIVEFVHQPEIGPVREPEGLVPVPLRQRVKAGERKSVV